MSRSNDEVLEIVKKLEVHLISLTEEVHQLKCAREGEFTRFIVRTGDKEEIVYGTHAMLWCGEFNVFNGDGMKVAQFFNISSWRREKA
jgi:hypothetical protein